jgi:hypothetical protein
VNGFAGSLSALRYLNPAKRSTSHAKRLAYLLAAM